MNMVFIEEYNKREILTRIILIQMIIFYFRPRPNKCWVWAIGLFITFKNNEFLEIMKM
jgi:hypothetical protein